MGAKLRLNGRCAVQWMAAAPRSRPRPPSLLCHLCPSECAAQSPRLCGDEEVGEGAAEAVELDEREPLTCRAAPWLLSCT